MFPSPGLKKAIRMVTSTHTSGLKGTSYATQRTTSKLEIGHFQGAQTWLREEHEEWKDYHGLWEIACSFHPPLEWGMRFWLKKLFSPRTKTAITQMCTPSALFHLASESDKSQQLRIPQIITLEALTNWTPNRSVSVQTRRSIRKQNKLPRRGWKWDQARLFLLFFSVFAIMRQMLSQYCLPYYGIPPSALSPSST